MQPTPAPPDAMFMNALTWASVVVPDEVLAVTKASARVTAWATVLDVVIPPPKLEMSVDRQPRNPRVWFAKPLPR
jgi:hypothetical protein